MFISFNILLNRLVKRHPHYSYQSFGELPDTALRGVHMLQPHIADNSGHYLYVCNEEGLQNNLQQEESILCVLAPGHCLPARTGVVYLYTEDDFSLVLNDLWDIYNGLRDWEKELDMALIGSSSLQSLIDLSEDVIGYPIVLYDAAQKVLAYTQHLRPTSPDDTIFKTVVEKGYLISDAVSVFMKNSTFLRLEKDTVIVENDVFDPTLQNVFSLLTVRNNIVAHLTVLCMEPEAVEYTKELIALLASKITFFFEKNMQSGLAKRQIIDYMFAEIIENTSLNPSDIQDKLRYLGFEGKGVYRLLCLDFSTMRQMPVELIANEIYALNNNYYPTIYGGKVYILIVADNYEDEARQYRVFSNILADVLHHYHGRCSYSAPFDGIDELREAYLQTSYVFEYLQQNPPIADAEAYFYDSAGYRIPQMFRICGDTLSLHKLMNPKFLALINSDQDNRLQILRAYLMANGNSTNAAAALHMHRNSVIYHIQQLEEAYGIDLSDPNQRLDWMLSLKLQEYIEGQ